MASPVIAFSGALRWQVNQTDLSVACAQWFTLPSRTRESVTCALPTAGLVVLVAPLVPVKNASFFGVLFTSPIVNVDGSHIPLFYRSE